MMPGLSDVTDASGIHQAHLDTLSEALLQGDFERFAEGVSLPHTILSESGDLVIADRATLEEKFDAYHRTLMSQGVTGYLRISTEAQFIDPETILGTHETHILRRGHRLVQPYHNRVELRKLATGWRETVAANAIVGDNGRMQMPQPSEAPPRMPHQPSDA